MRYDCDLSREYAGALADEIRRHLERADAPAVRSLYFGGGTPSLTPDHVGAVMGLVGDRLLPDAEVGLEAHPRDCSPELLEHLRQLGVTRISIGVETLDDAALRFLGRGYTPSQAMTAVEAGRSAGFECVDANLIFAVPGQQPSGPVRDAQRLIAAGVDQISAYPLFRFAHTRLGRRPAASQPGFGERARLRMQRELSQVCRDGGLERSSVWSFTRPGVAPYSTVTHEEYVGFGAGAGSKVVGQFWFNTFPVPEHCRSGWSRPALVLHADERARRVHWVYWALYQTRVSATRYAELFGRDLDADFGGPLRAGRALGWLKPCPDGWRVTEDGAIWGHRLQALFSLDYIDTLWQRCQDDPWPQRVELS